MLHKRLSVWLGLAFLAIFADAADRRERVSWLPVARDEQKVIRLLGCTYENSMLVRCEELGASSPDWHVEMNSRDAEGGRLLTFTFTALRDMQSAGVAVAFDCYGWSTDNYVMIPAAVYGANRQRIVNRQYATGLDATDYRRPDLALTSNPIPQLSPEYGAVSRLELNVSNTATPAFAILERLKRRGTLLLTDQGIVRPDGGVADHGLCVEESAEILHGSRWGVLLSGERQLDFLWMGGGLMNTFPMLALGDDEHFRRVKNTFDFALPRAKGKSGFYYDLLNEDGKVFLRDAARLHPEVGLTRKI